MTIGRPLFAKLFMEGLEVPFIGASITNTVNQAGIAYIDLVPHESINNVKPRTLVHLFVRDINDVTGSFPYVLAFQGEVFGINFGKTTTSRTFSISCIDHSSYWDNVLTYFFNPIQSLGKGASQIYTEAQDRAAIAKSGGSVNVSHSTSAYFKTVIDKAFAKAKAEGRDEDLVEGLVAIFKDITNVNDFYKAAEDRLRVVDRIVSASSGEVQTLLKQKESLDWLMGIANGHSGMSTLRMTINDLLSVIFHDFTSLSFPALVDSAVVSKSLVPGKTKNTIGEFIFKPNMYMMPPPLCNVFFPDEYSSFQYNRNFMTEPTRLIYKPEIPSFPGAGIEGVALKHVYEPEAFNHFMLGKGPAPKEILGDSDVQVDNEVGHFGDEDNLNGAQRPSTNGKKREQQLLTNEEKYKGIIIAEETMVPAASSFKQNIDEIGRRDYSKAIAKYLFYKKRFETRQVQVTSHLKMSVVPGFTVLVLDDSSAKQNITAYCSSVTHRIYCTQGGYTNTTLSYARTVNEEDTASGKSGEPLIPPWFKKSIFGEKKAPAATSAPEIDAEVKEGGEQNTTPKELSKYYARLIGSKGSMTINDYSKQPTMVGATEKLLADYRLNKKRGNEAVSAMIDKITRRRYISLKEAFSFVSASSTSKNDSESFQSFFGKRLFGEEDTFDSKQLKARRAVISKYRNNMKNERGFRG